VIEDLLVDIVGAAQVDTGTAINEDDTHDEALGALPGRPLAVVRPGSTADVAEIVRAAAAHGVPLTPRGSGTGLSGASTPVDGGLVVSFERMDRILEIDTDNHVAVVQPGVTLVELDAALLPHRLIYPVFPGEQSASLGGNVATNAGGPHALKYGVTGAWVSGLEVVVAPGELIELGGWIGKDVAGYDLKRLLIGSEGTLGVITAVRLRLLPAPEAAIPVVVFLRTRADGCAAIGEIFAAGLQPSVLDFLDGDTLEIVAGGYPGVGENSQNGRSGVPAGAGFALVAEVDGTRAQAAAQRAELVELLAAVAVAIDEPADADALWRWRDGVNGQVTAARGAKVSEDIVFPIERLQAGLEGLEEIATRHGLRSCAWGHGGDGNVHATVLVDPAREQELDAAEAVGEELFALAVSLGGSIAGEHGVGWLKRGRLESQWPARAVELHEQIKRVFDPKGLLNPGKKLARYPARSPLTTN
jgi:glycolate oxidase subunit GlcD